MNRIIFAVCAPMALLACATGQAAHTAGTVAATTADAAGVPPPVTYADRTVLDEKGITGLELAYKAARIAVETGVDTGLIKGATATRFAELDNKAFLALSVARGAYATGNATSYKKALSEAEASISGLLGLTGKGA